MMTTPTIMMAIIACTDSSSVVSPGTSSDISSVLSDAHGVLSDPNVSPATEAAVWDAPGSTTLRLAPAAPETELPLLALSRTADQAGEGVNASAHENAGENQFPSDAPLEPFAKGSRYWSLTFGTSRDPDIGRIYVSQFSVDHYFEEALAFRAGFTIGYTDAERTSGGVQGGPEFGLRWHLLRINRFSMYIDGSVAAVFHQNPLTPNSLHFNFDLQAGLGATLQVEDATHLKAGLRWHHLSNARIRGTSRNLGYDAPIFYVGLMRSF